MLRADISGDGDFRQRFIREADLAAALSHPNIVTVYDRGECDGQLWIAAEYVDGTDALALMRDVYPQGTPPEKATTIITAIASALDHAHQAGMLHRDVKPANILVAEERVGRPARIALADSGIARVIDDPDGLTHTNLTLGTLATLAVARPHRRAAPGGLPSSHPPGRPYVRQRVDDPQRQPAASRHR